MFLTYLVWDAVLLENTTQLFASMLLALAISAARIVSNSVGKETQNFKGQAVGWFILIMHAITIVSFPFSFCCRPETPGHHVVMEPEPCAPVA